MLAREKQVRLFSKLSEKLTYLPTESVQKISEAYAVASEAHKNQKRHSGEPYITHPLAVAIILAIMHMDAQTIMAALLHDVIEDTGIEKKVLADQFGEAVADLVDGVSKLTRIEFKNKAEAQAENFHKMVLAMSKDIRVVIIKLTDRLHNMRTLTNLPPEKKRRIAKETLEIYAPIANRLGMHTVFTELENLGFIALYPERHRVLKETVTRMVGNQKKIMHMVDKSLNELLKQHHFSHCKIYGREKNLYSIYTKMRNRSLSLRQITDVFGFRIITDSIDTCYRILGIVHSLYKPLPEKFKDYIAIPKANGYQSLHTTLFGPYGVPIEIQIRTQTMDQIANNGIAAHWLYKSDEKTAGEAQLRAQQWVKNLLEMQQTTGNSAEFIENVKIDLFPGEVYVFTPKGKIMELPQGASVVDFAYAVHTDIGNSCVAARVDRQLAPLSTVLINGQTVEIISSKEGRPNPAWLDFVVTARARSGIRHYIHTKRRKESIVLGKGLLNQTLKSLSLSLKKISPQTLQKIMQITGAKTLDDLLEDIGLGNRLAVLVAHQLAEDIKAVYPKEGHILVEKPLLIKGTEGMLLHFAACCYPIPGDPITGILTAGEGLMVHMESCIRIRKQRRHPEKFVTVSWSDGLQGEFIASLVILAINEHGVLAKLAQAISDVNANIEDIKILERDTSHYQVSFKIYVKDRVHLAHIIRNLRHIKSVVKVMRKV
jgi:guanosine-3',5'-bis(diphosphate) 3'-pyrophosphohydrolase